MNTFAYLTDQAIDAFIKAALIEDIGDGDHTSLSSIPQGSKRKARLLVKDDGILAGMDLGVKIFHQVDPHLKVQVEIKDGEAIKKGDIALNVEGDAISILSAERLVLNCMQRMSGIATYTKYMQSLIDHTKAKVLDTRKTTPNFRLPEKWAVAIGGGVNHRYALYDMILLKDNHVDFAGGMVKALDQVKDYLKEKSIDLGIVVETRNLQEVQTVLNHGGIDRIMLDNFSPANIKEAIKLIDGRFPTEASGGITEETIASYAEAGVDFISVGALTHSVKSLDLSLKAF